MSNCPSEVLWPALKVPASVMKKRLTSATSRFWTCLTNQLLKTTPPAPDRRRTYSTGQSISVSNASGGTESGSLR